MKLILSVIFALFFFHAQAEECMKAPTPVCLVEKAYEQAKIEPEGWAMTSLFEMLLANDPDLARREQWLVKYVEFANSTKIEGIKERIPAIKAEHLARIGKFEEAYKALGLLSDKQDPNADPALLISDEAKAGHIKEALSRINQMLDDDQRDDSRIEILSIALEQNYQSTGDIITWIKDKFTKRLAQSSLYGAKGDLKSFQKDLVEWVKTAKSDNEFPFDTQDNTRFESYDAYFKGAIAAKNTESFKIALTSRGDFTTSDEAEYVAKLLRPLLRAGQSDLIILLATHVKLPAGTVVSADEDLNKLKKLPLEALIANVKAIESLKPASAGVIDQTVETLMLKGQFSHALRLFIDSGRLNDLNKAGYDQDRIVPVFETLYRMSFAKKLPELAELTSKITHDKAKDYFTKITSLQNKLNILENATLTEEPNEEDWSLMVDLLLHEGNLSKTASVMSRIKEAGLQSSAFTQLIRHMWEKL